jgi:hypothetical protein
MIPTPYRFEESVTDEEFKKLGQFTLRWSHIDHTIGNCLRRMLDMDPKPATVMIFPLSMDARMSKIGDLAKKLKPMTLHQQALFNELKPLVKAMQFIRNTAVHGILVDLGPDEGLSFHLRSKQRAVTKDQLFGCEDLVNYAAHVASAFRVSLGEKHDDRGQDYALPDRPPVPDFFPDDCRAFAKKLGGPKGPPE